VHKEPLYPGIGALVSRLAAQQGVVLGVATGKSRRGVAHVFDMHGLHSHFITVQTADTHPSKPHPSMIMTAMAEAGADPGNTIMIGDTTFDVEMGRNAGVASLGVSWGYHDTAALHQAGAHAVVDDAAGLEAAIAALAAGDIER
jgi:phosphoglycolate phosphatase